jgi:hypothetical protein
MWRGYGVAFFKRQQIRAHRLSWQIHHGDIPPNAFVCHTCDNPACVNPKHLFLGSAADNSADMVRKGRSAKGARVASSKLQESDVLKIRSDNRSSTQIAKDYGVSGSMIRSIKRRQWWKHL